MAVAAGLAALLIGSMSDSGGGTEENYTRCELCNEPAGFSGRWCDRHASVVQEQINLGR